MDDDAPNQTTAQYEMGIHRATFDAGSEPVSDAVVRIVSTVTGTTPEELEAIDEVVDPIIFDALVRRQRRDIELRFVYNGQIVTVHSDGQIAVREQVTDGSTDQTFHFQDSESASEAVVRAIAEVTGTDPMHVTPMYDYVDTDALDALFERESASDVVVSFQTEQFRVSVSADNYVTVSPLSDSE